MTETHVVRLWLPDRPGALGAVASRIGAVRGDVVGIEILERGAGRAIDELVVEVPDGTSLDLLVAEICEVDGVDVESVRPVAEALHDPRLEALETAAQLVAVTDSKDLGPELLSAAMRIVGAAWVALVDLDAGEVVAEHGATPQAAWLVAFVDGSRASQRASSCDVGPPDVLEAALPAAGHALVMGRDGTAFRARERRQVAALARIADSRWQELSRSRSHGSHPAVSRR